MESTRSVQGNRGANQGSKSLARLRPNPSVRVAVAPEVLKLREDGEEGGREEVLRHGEERSMRLPECDY